MRDATSSLIMGAVAYDPKVVTIWDGFREFFGDRGLDFDYVLYSNYERQVAAHLAGHIHVGKDVSSVDARVMIEATMRVVLSSLDRARDGG